MIEKDTGIKALRKVSHGHGRVELVDLPEPHAEKGHVVVRVERAGICGTDIHILHDQFSKVRPPVTLGHEFAGSIAEVGIDVRKWRVGDRVVVESEAYSCGFCRDCLSGFTNLCSERLAYGYSSDGGFAPYVAVRASGLHRIPEKVAFQEAALSEPLAVGVHAVMECAEVKAGDKVLVTGPGPIGLISGEPLSKVVGLTNADARIVMLKGYCFRLELFKYYTPPGSYCEPKRQCDFGLTHFALSVKNIHQIYKRLLKDGVQFNCPPQNLRPGVWAAYMKDPEGNTIELVEYD